MSALDRIRRTLRPRKAAEPLACSELVELVTDYLEGSLPTRERARFDAHLEGCDGCRIYLDQMLETIQLVGRLSEETIPKEARDTMLRAFASWKQR